MKLKHMTVQSNRMPDRPATLYYAYGEQDGKMYESHMLVKDIDTIAMDDERLNLHVTHGLSIGIRELTPDELSQRAQEMREAVLQ